MDDPSELAGEVAGNIVGKSLDSEAVRNLLSPVTRELGLALGDFGSVVRFYTNLNLRKIFKIWAEHHPDRRLSQEQLKKILPLLHTASLQSDADLQERWATLLETTVSDSSTVLPSFSQTLSQLTTEEARYLDRLWKVVTTPTPYVSDRREGRSQLGFWNLVDIYEPGLKAPSPAELRVYRDQITPQHLTAFDKMTKIELIIQDLERLGILVQENELRDPPSTRLLVGSERYSFPNGSPTLETNYSLTQYGVSFIQAVTPKRVDP